MKREFLINISILLGLNFIVKPLYVFGIERGIHDRLGNESFELYLSLFSIAVIFQIVNDLGIQTYISKRLSESPGELGAIFPSLLGFKFFLGVVYFVLLTGTALLLNYDWSATLLLLGLGLVYFLSGILQFFRANLAGLGKYRRDSLLSALDRSLLIIILSAMLLLADELDFDLSWFIRAQILSMSLSVGIGFLVLRPYLRNLKFNVERSVLKTQLLNSLPYALAVLMMALYSRMDQVMLDRLLDQSGEGGVYGMSYRLLDVFNMIGFLFAGLLLPMFSRMHANKEDVRPLITLSSKTLLGGIIILATSVAMVSEDLLSLMYPNLEVSARNGEITLYLMGSLIAMSGAYVYGTYLVATDRLKQLNYVFLASLLLNFSLNLVWIPEQGAVGAAKATFITQSLVFLIEFMWVFKLGLIEKRKVLLPLLSMILVMIGLSLSSPYWLPKGLWYSLGSLISLGLVSGFILGMFPLKDLLDLLRSKKL